MAQTSETQEAGVERSKVQGLPGLQTEFKASLVNPVRFCFKINKEWLKMSAQ